MFELDLFNTAGSLIKRYQINETELSCGCFLVLGCRETLLSEDI